MLQFAAFWSIAVGMHLGVRYTEGTHLAFQTATGQGQQLVAHTRHSVAKSAGLPCLRRTRCLKQPAKGFEAAVLSGRQPLHLLLLLLIQTCKKCSR
jgi:hypothetical protein